MAKLIVNPTSSSRREIPLARTLVSIGRDPTNDLVLPDAMVSRRHAVIEYRGNQYFLRDCNSSNGSLVNGDRVSERNLRDGDLVAIGTARLLFREELDAEELGAKVVQHPSSPRLNCPSCQADYRKGDLFCRQCGTSVAPVLPAKAICTSCGTAVPLPARFCNACGRVLDGKEEAAPAVPPAADNLEITKPREVPNEPGPPPEPDPGPGPREEPPAELRPDVPPIEAAFGPSLPAKEPPEVGPLPPAEVHHTPRGGMVEGAVARAAPKATPPPMVRPAAVAAPAPRAVPPPIRSPRSEPEREVRRSRTGGGDARFGVRLAATLIDTVIVSLVQLVLMAPVLYYWRTHEPPPAPADVPFWPILLSLFLVPVVLALGCVYYVYYWGVKGATPGKRLLGLAVQATDGTEPIGLSRATVRVLGYLLSGLLAGIPFLMIAFGGTGLHDRMAGTRVVRRERG